MCLASQTPGLRCAVLSAPSDLYAFILYLYFTVNFVWRISPCKLRVCVVLSRPSLEIVRFCFVPIGELMFRVFASHGFPLLRVLWFWMHALPRKQWVCVVLSLLCNAIPSTPIFNFIVFVFTIFFVRVSSPERWFLEFSSVPNFKFWICTLWIL